MRKLVLKMSVSIDGFVGGLNGEIDWILRSLDESVTAWLLDTLWQAGIHIMGSRTFHDMAAYWPFSTEPFAAPMNEIPKVVFSKKGFVEPDPEMTTTTYKDATRLKTEAELKPSAAHSLNAATWTDAVVASGDLAEEILHLKQQPGNYILAHGGARFAQSLAWLGLIDEYRLLIHPVALGSGLPLFSTLSKPINLRLMSTTLFNNGAVAHIYRPANNKQE